MEFLLWLYYDDKIGAGRFFYGEKSIYGSMLYIYDGMIKLKDIMNEVMTKVIGYHGTNVDLRDLKKLI